VSDSYRRASEQWGVSYQDFSGYRAMYAPPPPAPAEDKSANLRTYTQPEAAATETTVDGTLTIGRFVVRLQLLIRRSRRE
jgi:hypothetical protein